VVSSQTAVAPELGRQARGTEVLLVLGVSLGASAVWSILRIIERLTREVALSEQSAAMNVSRTPERPWLDLAYQLAGIGLALVPVLLVLFLLNRDPGGGRGLLGLDARRPVFDLGAGALLALVIGLPGLGLYFVARWLGLSVAVLPANLADVWWAVPVLVLAALQNAIVEEVIVVGYLVTRLGELRWRVAAVVAASALLRGAYHLYQGFGAFVGNVVMGVVFALIFLRTRRVVPLIIAHAVIDIVAFVGYALFRDTLNLP
jgi:membrane protease YdiL (CAAX protease family)